MTHLSPHFRRNRHRAGFTLVEVLVVIGIMSFVLPTVTIVLFIILRQQLMVARLTLVKRQGDQALAVIQRVIEREAVGMQDGSDPPVPICDTMTTAPQAVSSFVLSSGDTVSFVVSDGALTMVTTGAGGRTDTLIDPAKVVIDQTAYPAGIQIRCVRPASYTHPFIAVDFVLQPSGLIGGAEQTSLRMRYSSKIMLRR